MLDIDLIIEKKDALPEVTRRLIHLGYTEKGEQGIPGRFAFRQLTAYTPLVQPEYHWQGHHLYVCYANSLALRNHLLFRDTLLSNKHLAEQYNALKKALMQNPAITREQYTIAKTDFIISVLAFAGLDENELKQIAEANK
jgi:GrpB-like predicted nucleotidyltransferase (UPF0157 family)